MLGHARRPRKSRSPIRSGCNGALPLSAALNRPGGLRPIPAAMPSAKPNHSKADRESTKAQVPSF